MEAFLCWGGRLPLQLQVQHASMKFPFFLISAQAKRREHQRPFTCLFFKPLISATDAMTWLCVSTPDLMFLHSPLTPTPRKMAHQPFPENHSGIGRDELHSQTQRQGAHHTGEGNAATRAPPMLLKILNLLLSFKTEHKRRLFPKPSML